jgi:hypothetical protein
MISGEFLVTSKWWVGFHAYMRLRAMPAVVATGRSNLVGQIEAEGLYKVMSLADLLSICSYIYKML